MTFSHPDLSMGLCRAADDSGYKNLFPIQEEVIPVILAGKDAVVAAETGSGKTAAFLLPVIQMLSERKRKSSSSVKVLILVPTRELAVQVEEAAKKLCSHVPEKLKTAAVYGGAAINPQMKYLAGGADILIATPGRLIELTGVNAVNLSGIEILILDEADRLLDSGFSEEIGKILKMLPAKRQNLLFSATLRDIIDIPGMDFFKNAVRIGISTVDKPAEPVEQIVYRVDQNSKGPLLRQLIINGSMEQVLVFVSSIRRADNIARKLLANKIAAEAFHGDKSQGARTGALTRFKQGKIRVLVATDLASRGLDIAQLPYVINYELPRSAADYIHRIGRTGRAGEKGTAITLLSDEELHHMKLIEKRMGEKPVYIESGSVSFK